MFDGKIFFGVTGTPIRNTALVNSAFADAEPVPFTFANLITKSFIFMPLSYYHCNVCTAKLERGQHIKMTFPAAKMQFFL